MTRPTAADVRGWSKLSFNEYGFTQDDGPGGLQVQVDRAVADLQKITGIDVTALPGDDPQVPLIQQVVQGLTEQRAINSSPEIIETLSDFGLVGSFSAGPYSETRRSPREAHEARLLNAWPWLSDLLWDLLTPDRYDYWFAFFTGNNVPAWGVSEVEWNHDAIGFGDLYPYG